MATTHKVTRTTSIAGRSVSDTLDITGEVAQTFDLSITDATTDELVAIAFAVAKLKSIIIKSDQDITVETNDGATPIDTINVKKAMAFQWIEGEERANPFGTDVTAFFITNASGFTAKVEIEVLYDEVA